MIETFQKEWSAKITLLIFIFFTIYWILLKSTQPPKATDANQLFAALYGLIALWGASWGLIISKKWGFVKSIMGRAILMFSLGLFFQEFGQIAYSYYIYYVKIAVPYPSIGDIGYFGSIPLYSYGVYLLARASGVNIRLRSFKHRFQAIIIPLIMLSIGYFLFLKGYKFDWSKPLTVFLDFGYPLGEAIYISLAIITYLLSKGILGGLMKPKIIFIIIALLAQFLSDYTFLYQNSKNIWYAGGINDYMYLCAYFLMTLGLIQFNTVLSKLKSNK